MGIIWNAFELAGTISFAYPAQFVEPQLGYC